MELSFRIARKEDAVGIADIYAPIVRDTTISFESEPPTAAEMERRMLDILPTHPYLVCVDGDTIAGYCYASPHRSREAYQWSCECSVYVGEAYRGKRVGRTLYSTLFKILKLQGFCNVYAGITQPNDRSVDLHQRMGFSPVGMYRKIGFKSGKWHDVQWWVIRMCGEDEAPGALHKFPDIAESEEVAGILAQAAISLSESR